MLHTLSLGKVDVAPAWVIALIHERALGFRHEQTVFLRHGEPDEAAVVEGKAQVLEGLARDLQDVAQQGHAVKGAA